MLQDIGLETALRELRRSVSAQLLHVQCATHPITPGRLRHHAYIVYCMPILTDYLLPKHW